MRRADGEAGELGACVLVGRAAGGKAELERAERRLAELNGDGLPLAPGRRRTAERSVLLDGRARDVLELGDPPRSTRARLRPRALRRAGARRAPPPRRRRAWPAARRARRRLRRRRRRRARRRRRRARRRSPGRTPDPSVAEPGRECGKVGRERRDERRLAVERPAAPHELQHAGRRVGVERDVERRHLPLEAERSRAWRPSRPTPSAAPRARRRATPDDAHTARATSVPVRAGSQTAAISAPVPRAAASTSSSRIGSRAAPRASARVARENAASASDTSVRVSITSQPQLSALGTRGRRAVRPRARSSASAGRSRRRDPGARARSAVPPDGAHGSARPVRAGGRVPADRRGRPRPGRMEARLSPAGERVAGSAMLESVAASRGILGAKRPFRGLRDRNPLPRIPVLRGRISRRTGSRRAPPRPVPGTSDRPAGRSARSRRNRSSAQRNSPFASCPAARKTGSPFPRETTAPAERLDSTCTVQDPPAPTFESRVPP